MPATTTRRPVAAATPIVLTASTPRQGDLLDVFNYPARVSEADLRKAKKLLKLWYPMSYNLWLEHNG